MSNPPALTLTRPWGWAIIHAGKDVENRTWPTRYRGPLFIHQGAGKSPEAFETYAFEEAQKRLGFGDECMVASVILGWVSVVGCHREAEDCCGSEWGMPDQWHWELTDPRPLVTPVPAKGALQLWHPKPDVLAAIREAA